MPNQSRIAVVVLLMLAAVAAAAAALGLGGDESPASIPDWTESLGNLLVPRASFTSLGIGQQIVTLRRNQRVSYRLPKQERTKRLAFSLGDSGKLEVEYRAASASPHPLNEQKFEVPPSQDDQKKIRKRMRFPTSQSRRATVMLRPLAAVLDLRCRDADRCTVRFD